MFTGAMLDHAAAVEEEEPGIDTATLPKLLDPVAFIASQVIVSLVLGILLGGISGYFGGTIDLVIQRAIELLQAIPRIPLWLTLSAALPRDWGTVEVYLAACVESSSRSARNLPRTVRARPVQPSTDRMMVMPKYLGASEMRIIIRHMVPSFSSHLIAALTLRVPEMIPAETSRLSGPGAARTGDKLGGAADRGAEHPRGGAGAMAVPARGGDRGHRAGLLLRR